MSKKTYLLLLFLPFTIIANQNNSIKGAFTSTTVGADGACAFSSIQSAIDAGFDEIKIASNKTYNENLLIDNQSVTLRGGFQNCGSTTINTQSFISGILSANLPVISITGNSQRYVIIIENFILSNGEGSGFFPGGGISTLSSDALINIFDTTIKNNSGTLGGGIAAIAGTSNINLHNTIIEANTADTGGGILCDGSQNTIDMHNNSGIFNNNANGTIGTDAGNGGGVFLANGCQFTITSGTANSNINDKRGISSNQASSKGGGLYVKSGASATLMGQELCDGLNNCVGNNTDPINLSSNLSDSDSTGDGGGAGAYITGTMTHLTIAAGKITENFIGLSNVAGNGGAISVNDGANLEVSRSNKACWHQEHCNYFSANSSGLLNGHGGAIFNAASSVIIQNTVFTNNRADQGTVLYGHLANSENLIKASMIHHNGNNGLGGFDDNSVFWVTDSAKIELHHCTVADNNAQSSVFTITSSATPTGSRILSSIIHDESTGNVVNTNPAQLYTNGNIFHETNSLISHDQSIIADPIFVDRAAWNYHIDASTSPAVDFIYSSLTSVDYKDIDFEDYGWDDPNISNINGFFDAGADETYGNDIIFQDGFN
jgi:hypothetical protein